MMKCSEPIQIGHLTIKNRFSMAPMDVRLHTHDGYVTDRSVAHYKRMAQGGVGLINLELHVVRADGIGPYFMDPQIRDDSYIPGMAEIAKAIHSEGAACQVELGHFGKFSAAEVALAVSASVPPASIVPGYSGPDKVLHELTDDDIEEVLEDFVTCAIRVQKATFDGVLLHGAHGFLPQQFMSPHSNRRTDKWGKDRMLFATELVRRVRTACGERFLIGYRLSGDEYYQKLYPDIKGYTVDDLAEIVPRLCEAGVTSIDITGGALDVPRWYAGPDPNLFEDGGDGGYLPLAAAAKKFSSVPIIVTGRMGNPSTIEKALEEGLCDMVGLAKPMLADPDLPRKMIEGRAGDVRRCIDCGYCAVGGGGLTAPDNHSVQCAINPEIGWIREGYHAIRPAHTPRRVLVAGGGCGGMEAARVLKLRGHDVSLYEATGSLGGQIPSAAVAPGKADIALVNDYLIRQLDQLQVPIHLNTEVTVDLVERERPDVLVVATGAQQFFPPIAGIDAENVVGAWDVLLGRAQAGQRVVFIGGEEVACEAADYLSEDPGRDVTLTSLLPGFATKGHVAGRRALANLHGKKAVHFLPAVRQYIEINEQGVRIVDASGAERLLVADTVVIAAGAKPVNRLAQELANTGFVKYSIFTIGDAKEARSIKEAMHEGAVVAQHI